MMTDERLIELLDDAARTWRVPPEPDLPAMWSRIEEQSLPSNRHIAWWRSPSWRTFGLGLAAALTLGVGLGRLTARGAVPPATVASVDSVRVTTAYDRAATELLGRTALLLTALPSEAQMGGAGERFATQATGLLTSTRLLLDSPASADARFKDLLEDLELVLAQIASLQSGRTRQEIARITDALEGRDVVPRIRSGGRPPLVRWRLMENRPMKITRITSLPPARRCCRQGAPPRRDPPAPTPPPPPTGTIRSPARRAPGSAPRMGANGHRISVLPEL